MLYILTLKKRKRLFKIIKIAIRKTSRKLKILDGNVFIKTLLIIILPGGSLLLIREIYKKCKKYL